MDDYSYVLFSWNFIVREFLSIYLIFHNLLVVVVWRFSKNDYFQDHMFLWIFHQNGVEPSYNLVGNNSTVDPAKKPDASFKSS